MKSLTIKKLQEAFIGKPVTILTKTIAKNNFKDDMQFGAFFSCVLESVDEDGVFGKAILTGKQSFYAWSYIVGIVEEEFISENSPEYKSMLEKKCVSNPISTQIKKPIAVAKNTILPNQFINLEEITKLTQEK